MSDQNIEEVLREMCCYGDLEKVKVLLCNGVKVNSQNNVNGWTALHWAAKRNHQCVVVHLLENGADPSILTFKGEHAIDLTEEMEIKRLFSFNEDDIPNDRRLHTTQTFVPNYIENPEFPYSESVQQFSQRLGLQHETRGNSNNTGTVEPAVHARKTADFFHSSNNGNKDEKKLVLKFRLAESSEKDFIEIELDAQSLSFSALVNACLTEFDIEKDNVSKIRKLPNTIVRNDKDVARLQQFQEMEIVLKK